METYGFDAGPISLAAIAFLMACIALRSWMRRPKDEGIQGELLIQIRDELRNANASLGHMKEIVREHQAALEKTATTLESMRRSADDHASDVKSAIERISGAIDAGRAEATTRHNSMTERVDAANNTAADAREHATNAEMAANGLRKQIDVVADEITVIGELHVGIDGLQESVTALAQAMPTPRADTPPKPKAKRQRTSTKGRAKRGGKKDAADKTPPSAASPPSDEAATGDADAPVDASPQTDAAPREEPPPAAAALDAGSNEPGKPGNDTAATDNAAGDHGLEAATGTGKTDADDGNADAGAVPPTGERTETPDERATDATANAAPGTATHAGEETPTPAGNGEPNAAGATEPDSNTSDASDAETESGSDTEPTPEAPTATNAEAPDASQTTNGEGRRAAGTAGNGSTDAGAIPAETSQEQPPPNNPDTPSGGQQTEATR